MLFLFGLMVVFASVLYGFVMAEGQLLALWQPFEFLIIIGAAFGSFLVSNPWHLVVRTFALMPDVIIGSKINKFVHIELLCLIHDLLIKMRREGVLSLEEEVENYHASAIFLRYPLVTQNPTLCHFIADYFRILSAGNLNAYELETLIEQELDGRRHELELPAMAMGKVADALPGFGIIAAVLGIVITMGALGGDMNHIGRHVASALVGTFSGVLLAYGVAGPISSRMFHLAEEHIKLYEAVKSCVVASLNGLPPKMAVEFGRKSLFTFERPEFNELESMVRKR